MYDFAQFLFGKSLNLKTNLINPNKEDDLSPQTLYSNMRLYSNIYIRIH